MLDKFIDADTLMAYVTYIEEEYAKTRKQKDLLRMVMKSIEEMSAADVIDVPRSPLIGVHFDEDGKREDTFDCPECYDEVELHADRCPACGQKLFWKTRDAGF